MGIRKLKNRLLGRDIPFYFDILNEYLRKNEYVSFSLPLKIGGSGGSYSSGYLRPSDGSRECFPAGTKILSLKRTNNRFSSFDKVGTLSIEKIKIGDLVLSYDETTGKKEYKKVIRVFERSADTLLTIMFSNDNSICCTPEHPVAVNKNGKIEWIKARDLKINDQCLQYKYAGVSLRRYVNSIRGKSLEERYGEEKSAKVRNDIKNTQIFHFSDDNHIFGSKEFRSKWGHNKKRCILSGSTYDKEYGLEKSIEVKRKIGAANSRIQKELVQDPEYLKDLLGRTKVVPNNSEIYIMEILDELCPDLFNINVTGDAAAECKINFDGLIPDFFCVERKKIILFNGCNWHSCPECKKDFHPRKHDFEVIRKHDEDVLKRYEKLGWEVLTLWSHDKEGDVRKKILNFVYNPKMEIVTVQNIEVKQFDGLVYNLEVEDNNNYFAYGILVHNCEREILYLLSGAPADEEVFTINTFKRFVIGTTHHALWALLLKKAGEWSGKFKVVEGERLIDNELFVTGTPDFYVVTEDNSILNEWKTMDPSKYLQRAALESGGMVEIDRLYEMMKQPYKGNRVQCHWYGMMSLDNKFHSRTSDDFKEAVDKYKGDGYVVYEEKTQSMLIPHKVQYNYEELSPYVEKIRMVNKCFENGTVPGIRCRGKGERFNKCPYRRICRSEEGEKSRVRAGNRK